jgi:cellulose synthase/poly-beta-1,6-N-acetylglucosamine synthase-like glycosyltransferase
MAMSEFFAPLSQHPERARLGVGALPAAPLQTSRREAVDFTRVRGRLARCPEIDCLRHLLPPATLAAAELRAAEIGVGADRVLIAAGDISADAYAIALAQWLGVPFEPLDIRGRADCPLDDDRLITAGAVGLLPLIVNAQSFLVVAPRDARRLTWFLASPTGLASGLRITTPARIAGFVARHGAAALGHRAAHALKIAAPDLSAGANHPRRWLAAFSLAAIVAAAALAAPNFVSLALDVALALIFLGWAGLRLMGTLTRHSPHRARERVSDSELPVYTLLVALYREAPAAAELIKALAALDYPPEKLDIKLMVEADDPDTLSALAKLHLRAPFEIVTAPGIGPRTKPKALNVALPFARGTFVAIYDAEDRPEPDQLRIALDAFSAADARLACVQARLTIDNTADNWLTRLFTAEYAGLFDVFLPGLAARRLPLPLGGSSNHFRTEVVREIGAWDPYNVTEDADLGMRLFRFGYRTAIVDSTTYEEAPSRFLPWLRQRTRWFKGWMQTWLVHMRHPFRLVRQLGFPGFMVFQLVVGGTVLAALVQLIFAIALIWQAASGASDAAENDIGGFIIAGLHLTTLATGYVISGLLAAIGLARRGLMGSAWWLSLMPVYWLLLSIAAWRALFQLIRDPYAWEKTEHGLARSSRCNPGAARNAAPAIKDIDVDRQGL